MSRTRKAVKESPSKRLRDVFFVLWNQDKEGYGEFDEYYDSKMEKLIQHYKKLIKK